MLILTRKAGETIVIGGGIEVTVVRIDGGKVRLAFKAPRDVKVMRTELLERLHGSAHADAELEARTGQQP